jgi:hypothetical protein
MGLAIVAKEKRERLRGEETGAGAGAGAYVGEELIDWYCCG